MNALPDPLRTQVEPLGTHVSNWLGFTDPPKHTRMRKLIMKVFTPKLAEDMRPRIQQVTDGLIDRVQTQGKMDLIDDFAFPLPATVICEILGIPTANQEQFRAWIQELVAFVGGIGPSLANVALPAYHSYMKLADYFRDLTIQRRRDPRQDLLSALAAVEDEGEGLSEQELLGLCVFLFVAGHDTTVQLLGNGMWSLLSNPDQLARLRADPALAETAVEEFLRIESPVQIGTRLPREDLEIREKRIRQGQTVILMQSAANHDPEQFTDPDRLDIARQNNRHLAFGWGIHFCLGAPLARVEGQVAVNTLLRRLPGLRLVRDEPQWRHDINLRALETLPVTF
jgi:cytochrome P450